MIKFKEEGHSYTNIDEGDDFQWVSVTSLIGQFKEKFDAVEVSERCSKGKNLNTKGRPTCYTCRCGTRKVKRATDLGSYYHNQREAICFSLKQ